MKKQWQSYSPHIHLFTSCLMGLNCLLLKASLWVSLHIKQKRKTTRTARIKLRKSIIHTYTNKQKLSWAPMGETTNKGDSFFLKPSKLLQVEKSKLALIVDEFLAKLSFEVSSSIKEKRNYNG